MPSMPTYFHFRFLRGDSTRRTRLMSIGKIRRVINYKLHDLTNVNIHHVVLAEHSQTPPTVTDFRFRFPRGDPSVFQNTAYADAAYCYRPSSVVCRSVCRCVCRSFGLSDCRSVCHASEPCKNGCTDRDAVWVEDSDGPKEPRIRWGLHPHRKGQF